MRISYRWGLIALDTAIIAASTVAAVALRTWVPFLRSINDADQLVLPVAPLILAAWVLALAAGGAYRPRHWGFGVAEYRQVFNSSLFFLLALGFLAFIVDYPLSRGFVALLVAVGLPALIAGRITARRILQRLRHRGRFCLPTLVVGDQGAVDDVVEVLRRETWLGYTPVGIVAPPEDQVIDVDSPPRDLSEVGTVDDLLGVIDRTGARAVIFTTGSVRRGHEFNEMARKLENHRAEMVVVPAMTDISSQRIHVTPVAGLPLMHVGKPQAERSLRFTKRSFDLIASGMLLVFLSPSCLRRPSSSN